MSIAVILAGGAGVRMNSSTPKQFMLIKDKPVIYYTLEIFEHMQEIGEIMIVCKEDSIPLCQELCTQYSLTKVKYIISGGQTRHASITNAIKEIQNGGGYKEKSRIVIHHANQPLVSEKEINECMCLCDDGVIASSVKKCNEYFYATDKGDKELSLGPDRERLLVANVPEGILLKDAVDLYITHDFTEKKYESYSTGMLAILSGKKVIPVYGDSTNFKITTPADFKLLENLLK